MSKIRRTNQGGSIVTFVIIGVVLAALLIGSVYYLKQRGDQVRKDQAIAAADQQKADEDRAKSEAADKSDTNGTVTDDTDKNVTNAQNLPATGSEMSISGLVGIFLMSTMTTSYISSRRKLARYL